MNAPAEWGFPLGGRKFRIAEFEAPAPDRADGPVRLGSYAFTAPGFRLFKSAHNRKKAWPVL
jgi:hypothetical protein